MYSRSSRTGSLAETTRAFSQRGGEEEEEEGAVATGQRIRAGLRTPSKRNSTYQHHCVPSGHPYPTATAGDFPAAAVLPSKPLSRMDSWSKRKAGVAKAVEGVVKRRKHIVLVGLDGSGKTTVLTRLKYRCYVATTPTIGFNHEKVWGGGYRWSCWDVGGGERLRPLWSSYTRATDGIVFVVDSASLPDMMEEARVELARVLKKSRASSVQLGIPSPPLLVLANFQDQIHARSAQCVAVSLGLGEAMGVVWAVAPVCALTGEGLDDAMATLRTLIDKVRQEARRRDRWR